ncbi:MAG: hypothetical protein P8R42_25250 [Candidatus Binatia bacterium]|nr:hypothetical protein [Candidatus Binatia bacterium]
MQPFRGMWKSTRAAVTLFAAIAPTPEGAARQGVPKLDAVHIVFDFPF